MKHFLFLILCISVAACSQGFPIKENSTPAYPDLMISMERGPCFGTCPVYNLTIDADGNVAYEGRLFVAVEGIRNAKISFEKIQELVMAIEIANFFDLEDQYHAPATDLPSITLSITLKEQNKTIWHYGTLDCSGDLDTAPQELCELENKIDEIINTKQWIE